LAEHAADRRAILDRQRCQAAALEELTQDEALAQGDTTAFFARATEAIAAALNIGRVGVWLLDDARSAITCVDLYEASTHSHRRNMRSTAAEFPDYFATFLAHRVLETDHAASDPRTRELRQRYLAPHDVNALLNTTLLAGGEVQGVLACAQVGTPRPWAEDERAFALAAADLIALAIVNAERRRAETRLREAQKLEALGRLTGGIAHDFNNLLAVVIGNLDLLGGQVGADPRVRERIDQVLQAAGHGADLVRQLLAFARQQPLAPVLFDPGELIRGLRGLLGRSLGEAIAVRARITPDLWLCRPDPAQLEAALVNLALNARDAMPEGGELVIGAANVQIDGDVSTREADVLHRRYVMISVADSGHGMSAEVARRAFEPFFTTKGTGKGSGLGLSMVQGFIQQSGGFARIESAPGEGTTVRLCPMPTMWLTPRSAQRRRRRQPPPPGRPRSSWSRTTPMSRPSRARCWKTSGTRC